MSKPATKPVTRNQQQQHKMHQLPPLSKRIPVSQLFKIEKLKRFKETAADEPVVPHKGSGDKR